MNVGEIAYLNTVPYFYYWPSDAFTRVPGAPRELARKAGQGLIDAGPLPIVECWRLENDFEFLGHWGIAGRERCGSVFVVSQRPFAELGGATIGVTQDTSTSAMLCQLLLTKRYGLKVRMKRGLDASDDAWLVIGNQAMGKDLGNNGQPWTHVTDLATEWWNWQGKPFVFARWVARKTLSPGDRARLEWIIGESYERGMQNLPEVAQRVAYPLGFSPEVVQRYLSELVYEIDAEAEASSRIFRQLLDEAGLMRAVLAGVAGQ
jgi:chorismate dehydratase